MTPAEERRGAALYAIGPVLNENDTWLELSVREAIADAVLAAIQPYTEHCTHHVTVHRAHHGLPVDGCPWCVATASAEPPKPGTTDVPTGGLL